MKLRMGALCLLIVLAGCAHGGMSADQNNLLKSEDDALRAQAVAGKITWVDYAKQADDNFLKIANITDPPPRLMEMMSYHVLLASRADKKIITVEEMYYQWNKAKADWMAEEQQHAANNRAVAAAILLSTMPTAYPAIHCTTFGPTTTCN